MVKSKLFLPALLILLVFASAANAAEQAGGIRGMITDADFDVPLVAAQVSIAETGAKTVASDQGNFVLSEVQPGTYTLVFSKDGYARQVKANVVVSSGKMTEVDVSLAGDFTEMEEFVVQDVQIGAGTEGALLELRMESPALMDSVGSELMSRAGATDAASALRLVAGASVQDGKYAVVRGLPDRYVNSQMNGVRLPTADVDKRAVQLDQFPAAAIESIQVTKTFTPDQQGDASGGAVNVVLKGIPQERIINLGGQYSWNSMVQNAGSDFLTHKGGGVSTWGKDDRPIPNGPADFDSALGVSTGSPDTNYKWSVAVGDKFVFDKFKIGAFGSLFYDRKSTYYDDGIEDKYKATENPSNPGSFQMTPQASGSADPAWNPDDPYNPPMTGDFRSSLFDVKQGTQKVQWGGLSVLGFETENHALTLTYMYTRDTTDKTTLSENTRGKEYFFPGYDRNDPAHPGNMQDGRAASPYLRLETIEYTERTTDTLQLHGKHTLPDPEIQFENVFSLLNPEVDWTVSQNSATLDQPDKRMFGTVWQANGLFSPSFPDFVLPENHSFYLPSENVNYGNLQRIWKNIKEDSKQYSVNLKLPFEQWSGDEGYMKFGVFDDQVNRDYNQDTFSNPSDQFMVSPWNAPWEKFWSSVYPYDTATESYQDIDYHGKQDISAWYYMADVPLNPYFNIIGGARFESTDLSIRNKPDVDPSGNISANWLDVNSDFQYLQAVKPGAVYPNGPDVMYQQDDMLPSIGFQFKPWKPVILHGSYSETTARQTFKELSPILQQEYAGGPIFIGNPALKMSAVKNYDLRLDWTPYESGLVSLSYFKKDITNPIEYVQGYFSFDYTYPVNYPEGELHGYEMEFRQELGRFWSDLKGLSVGANATLITSEVTLPVDEAKSLKDAGAPEPKRDMMNAPEHLYNFFTTYDIEKTGTQLALFYTIRGDTLVAGAANTGPYVIPSVYETEYGTLNYSMSQKLGEIWKLTFQAKNLLDPAIDTVYRSKYIGDDVTKTSYHKGMDFSISLSASF